MTKINRSDFPRPNFNHIELGSVRFGLAHSEFSSVSVRFGFSKTPTDPNTDPYLGGRNYHENSITVVLVAAPRSGGPGLSPTKNVLRPTRNFFLRIEKEMIIL